ncbi:MAG TPA: sulfate ABC transporter ATP-binding protein [Candidatus Solibacter sp.]|nr:sulfate ABC transporter ATP-binding protein [Candidatus Solibacter sp.]
MRTATSIHLRNIHKQFGDFVALNNVTLNIRSGQLAAILGPSGSGKTTLLRIIAGLETQNGGSLCFDGEDMTHTSPRDRHVGFVFQHYALFRHMTVLENIGFGLKVQRRKLGLSKRDIRERALRLLSTVRLDGLENRLPQELSGGQRQRVALARALAIEPKVLLLDEPFGALDAKVRKDLRRWLRIFHEEMGITTVFVTHDQEEALEIADQIVVMNQGRIDQVGAPVEVFEQPATAFVREFLDITDNPEAASVLPSPVAHPDQLELLGTFEVRA